jgi:hypothetical protein
VGDIPGRVDTRVSAAGACDRDDTAAKLPERFFQALLDGRGGGLDLPAAEGGTVVGEAEDITHVQM